MARRATPIGPSAWRLIEDAPINPAWQVFLSRESNSEPEILLPASPADLDEHQKREFLRDRLGEIDREVLNLLELRCGRILTLADGKGRASLDTVVDQHLGDEDHDVYQNQPDALCRSIWTYLNFRPAFEDAESFHYARRYRDYGKLYDAFEVDLDDVVPLDSTSIDTVGLASRITEVLDLKKDCTVRTIDLPAADPHPASVMLIVRHGGPLSSVYNLGADGRRDPIYYRPPNEATLIYTPSTRQIEICADSPFVRREVSSCFAEVALGHDVSAKPLTWKRYDLSRFRQSLSLPIPQIDDILILLARVIDLELRLGDWTRRLSLKVTIQDDIEEVANRYLGGNSVVARADGFSRVSIGVRYLKVGKGKEQTLNITVSGTKACNLQSNKDPDQRGLGYALLGAWGILETFKQVDATELRAMLPRLVELFDRAEDDVSGNLLRDLQLDPGTLVAAGLIERKGLTGLVLLDEDDMDGEGTLQPSKRAGMVRVVGPFGENVGDHPAGDLEMYRLNRQWLQETVLALLKPLLAERTMQVIDDDLTLIGSMTIDGAKVPVYVARRLGDTKVLNRLDLLLRSRSNSGLGIVLSANREEPLRCLGPNVVMSLASHLTMGSDSPLSRESIALAYQSGRSLATGGSTPAVRRSGPQSATLYVPGKAPLSLVGANPIQIFDRLVAAHLIGSPDVKAGALLEGTGCRSPQQAFRKKLWSSIIDVYITKGARHGFWRLST